MKSLENYQPASGEIKSAEENMTEGKSGVPDTENKPYEAENVSREKEELGRDREKQEIRDKGDIEGVLRKINGDYVDDVGTKGILPNDHIDFAGGENERFDSLQAEKKRHVLYNNLGFGENPEISIEKAKKVIENQDTTGEKIKIFNEAIDYYSHPQEKIADVPIYHSTGSILFIELLRKARLIRVKMLFLASEPRQPRVTEEHLLRLENMMKEKL